MGLSALIQESLLTVLLYDNEHGGRVCSLVPVEAWDTIYRPLVSRGLDYWAKYKTAPGEQSIDLFTEVEAGDKRSKDQLRALWDSVQETREGINPQYVLSQVSKFLREQRLRSGIIESVEHLERGDLVEAEAVIQKSLKGSLELFEPGLLFHQLDAEALLRDDRVALPTGISLLDTRGLGPAAGELHLFIAPPGFGKSWWLIHLAKLAIANRKRVVYVTLEMSEQRVAQRLVQSFFGIAKRREEIVNKLFKQNELGQLIGLEEQPVRNLRTFADEDITMRLAKQLKSFGKRCPLVIKQFPTGMLTVRELNAYLDHLEMSKRIVPDLLLIDYADLMSVGTRDYRHELGNLYKDIRGLGVSRNLACATASQANRTSAGEQLITGRGVAEDYSKIATADVVVTYNRTAAEYKLGTARLLVDKGRNDEDKFLILITQNYRTGQFCLDSTRMLPQAYWSLVNEGSRGEDGDRRPAKKRERL